MNSKWLQNACGPTVHVTNDANVDTSSLSLAGALFLSEIVTSYIVYATEIDRTPQLTQLKLIFLKRAAFLLAENYNMQGSIT